MKYFLLISFSFLGILSSVFAENKINSDKSKHHIYLLIGQSNMAGRAKFTGSDTRSIEKAFLFDDKNDWEEAKNPLNKYSTIRKSLKMQKMGPGYHFAKTMIAKSKGITVGLVVNAKGGSKIAQWKKGTDFFNDAVTRTKKAMESGTLKGILWHQGEGDQKNQNYTEQLSQLIADLREALGNKDLPFVAGEIREVGVEINKQINEVPKRVKNTAVASSKGLTMYDGTHFDAASAKTLGERYAKEILKLIK